MKRTWIVAAAGFLLLGAASRATAQGYQLLSQASLKDAYCSGFITSKKISTKLHVVGAEDAQGRSMFGTNELIYLSRGSNSQVQLGERYQVVRKARKIHPTDTFKGQSSLLHFLGGIYQDVGWVEVVAVYPTTSTARVTFQCMGLSAGDALIPFEERALPDFNFRTVLDALAPSTGLAEGTIVANKEFTDMVGDRDPIYINLGTNQGVKLGDSYRIFRYGKGPNYVGFQNLSRGQIRRSYGTPAGYEVPLPRNDLPREILGEAFVVRVDDNTSTAIINASRGEILAGDLVEVQPPPSPQASLTVVPETIQQGQTATLSWGTKFANEMEVSPGIGAVTRRGTVNVNPIDSTTYTLTARGSGGERQATATLTVVEPPPPPVVPPPPPDAPPDVDTVSVQELFAESVRDIFFDFDRAEIIPEAASTMQLTADFLLTQPDAQVLIEGHCDEIGTEMYNLQLGTRRAEVTRDFLVSLGVNPEQLQTATLGKSRPFCTESVDESCRQLNRRAHFVLVPTVPEPEPETEPGAEFEPEEEREPEP